MNPEKQDVLNLFNGKEVKMNDFDLAGYSPEVVKDNDFEIITGKNYICKVNSSKIEDVDAGSNDRGDYEAYTRLRYELEIISEKNRGRRLWKSYNLSSKEKSGKKEKTPIQKLADAFFTLGLEFSDMDSLQEANEKFSEMLLNVSCSKFKPKGRDAIQLHTIIKEVTEDEIAGAPADSEAPEVEF